MEAPEKRRGRPKVPWEPFEEELWRRLTSGEASEQLEAEAEYLSKWAKAQGITQNNGAPLARERIRERIKKRYKGTAGYKATRQYHLAQLAASDLNKSDLGEK